jgi:hypothetical protein
MKHYTFTVPVRGYIAIVSAIIISAILTSLVFTESASVFWSRYDQSDNQNEISTRAVGTSCAYEALLQYKEDPASFSTMETISNDKKQSCIISVPKIIGTSVIFSVQARSGNSYTQRTFLSNQDLNTLHFIN